LASATAREDGDKEPEIHMLKRLIAILGDESGVSALEYAVIAALVAVVVIGSISLLGTNVSKLFSTVASSI
jgi:pilus assembly protein Flp/PilA